MKQKTTYRQHSAFTLMELMIVIIILGLLAALVMPNLTGKSEEAKQKLVCIQMKNISQALKMFKADNGRYPTTEEGLEALMKNPSPEDLPNYAKSGYLEDNNLPKDPWGHPFIYLEEDNNPELISLGADGKEGGNKENKDIRLSECK
ncbi:MAG TPA: type II secretion system protein GspG [Campylobacterales bacterium]|nr:type II secretion system protein GspG [Campylobacterales bacterium]